MTFVSASQFHIYLPWGRGVNARFRDYGPSRGFTFQALAGDHHSEAGGQLGGHGSSQHWCHSWCGLTLVWGGHKVPYFFVLLVYVSFSDSELFQCWSAHPETIDNIGWSEKRRVFEIPFQYNSSEEDEKWRHNNFARYRWYHNSIWLNIVSNILLYLPPCPQSPPSTEAAPPWWPDTRRVSAVTTTVCTLCCLLSSMSSEFNLMTELPFPIKIHTRWDCKLLSATWFWNSPLHCTVGDEVVIARNLWFLVFLLPSCFTVHTLHRFGFLIKFYPILI